MDVPPSATLTARAVVVIVDVSRGGCLLETSRPFDPGTVGTLQLRVDGRDYVEDFRVARCTALSGRGATFRIGVEFLRTRRETELSLRHAVAHLVRQNGGVAASNGSDRTADNNGVKGERHEHASADRAIYR